WYLAMLASGVALARLVAKRTGDAAALAVIPPALAVVGGPFVHGGQIAAALPAALVLYGHASPNVRRAIGIGIVLLAVPWIQFLNLGTIFVLLAPPIVALLVASFVDRRPLIVVASAVCAALFLDGLIVSITAPFEDATKVLLAHYDPTSLAEASWTTYVTVIGAANPGTFDVARIPTLLGLATIVCAAIGAGRKTIGEVPMMPGELQTIRLRPPRGRETVVPKELST
ncbi:MAG: hypothetical protein IAI50_05530, partial [Candidatus Eremiobacteraeota bacterium]|nr:hypothetical protein [Candidatus Eremiobacteraeota bacterium]